LALVPGASTAQQRWNDEAETIMWPRNALSERLNLEWPIFQAPMGSITTPALAAAVSNAGGLGGLGGLGMWGFSPDDAERRIAGFRQLSGGGLNVNYPLWPKAEIRPDVAEHLRRWLEPRYAGLGLGEVPQPRASEGCVSPEHLAMLIRARPEVVSFRRQRGAAGHGLPAV
jgi:nitronate monooxygenase